MNITTQNILLKKTVNYLRVRQALLISVLFQIQAYKLVYSRHSNDPEMTTLLWISTMWPSRGQMGSLRLERWRRYFKDIFQLHTFIFCLNTPEMWWPCSFSWGIPKKSLIYLPDSQSGSEYYHLLLFNNFDKDDMGTNYTRPNWRVIKIHNW